MYCRKKGLLARTMAICGIAMSISVARPAHAQSPVYAAPLPVMIYADCAATSRGNGSAARPYWRITDALEKARALRRRSPQPITIRVAAGTCSGNFEPQPTDQSTRPPELLPLVLNVPDLTLHGAGVMEYANGYPMAARAGTATSLTVDTVPLGDLPNTVIYVGPTTDGGRADGAVIEGLVIDSASNAAFGIDISRTHRLTLRGNVVTDTWLGAINGSECSGRIVGNVVHGGSPGLLFAGGTSENPSRLFISGNSATDNYEGVGFFGDSGVTDQLNMGANPLEPLPYPINPTASQMGNRIEVDFEGNDVSNNYFGLDFTILGGGRYPYAQTGYISANVHNNRFIDNAGYPFLLDEGFVYRGTSSFWTDPNPDPTNFPKGYLAFLAAPFITHGPFNGPYSGIVNARFEGNLWSNPTIAPIAPAILTFSNVDAYDVATGAPDPNLVPEYAYMRNSRLNIIDEDGLLSQPGVIREDLRLYDPLDGVALLNQTRIHR